MSTSMRLDENREGQDSSHRPALCKVLGRFGFFALVFGLMIGVGWVTFIGN